MYNACRLFVQVFADPPEGLLITLDKKANESAKYKGKKEKRAQRATFREIYNSFEVELVAKDGLLHIICSCLGRNFAAIRDQVRPRNAGNHLVDRTTVLQWFQ